MAMGFTTWRGMYLSGAGTNMGHTQEALIHVDRTLAPALLYAVARGTTTPVGRVVPIAAWAFRMPAAAILMDFVV
jgi:hypothetical protein